MLSRIKNWVGNHERNLGGWKTRRKIVVIESDDWGSIRMPSPDAYRSLKNLGIPVDKSPYCRYDSLASEEDIQNLYGMLQNHRDFLGRPPVITANVVVSNPDFDRIRESGWSEYFSEPISETFRKYPSHSGCLKLWNDGKSNRLFYMQSHGREHVNIHRWLELLREDFAGFRKAFDLGCWGLSNDVYPGLSQSIQAPFDLEQGEELKDHEQAVEEALILFQELFGYKSESFIAGNYIWSCELNKTLSKCGVKYLQGMKYQKLPRLNGGDREMIRHYLGERNEYDQLYLISRIKPKYTGTIRFGTG